MLQDTLTPLLKAITFAATKHKDHYRGENSTPYFSHITRVAVILRHHFGVEDRDIFIAAFLHDVLEDTDSDYDEIAGNFGATVADYVVALTKNALLPKSTRERDYEQRLLAAPELVRIAKLADIFDNLTDRMGTPKIVKTRETALRLTQLFNNTFTLPQGKVALQKVRELLGRISL